MNFVKRLFGLFRSRRECRREHAADTLKWNRREVAVFAQGRDAILRARDYQGESFAAATNRDDPTRLDNFIQPALAHFAARLWRAFDQTRARACQPLEAQYSLNRQCERGLREPFANPSLVCLALLFEPVNTRQEISIRETAFGDVAHLRETSERVEQIK